MKKWVQDVTNWSHEARVGIVIGLVAVLFFSGLTLLSGWWNAPMVTTSVTTTSMLTSLTTYNPTTISVTSTVVAALDEKLKVPFGVNATVARSFFDVEETSEEQENAIVVFDGKYLPSKGIDYVFNDTAFAVLAACSGTVVDKVDDPIMGLTVTIEAENGVQFVYGSMSSSTVLVGQEVTQGQEIGAAGLSAFGSDLDSHHLHFEILVSGVPVNPEDYFGQAIRSID